MTDALQQFLAKVSADESLKARVEALDMSDPEATVSQAIAIAKELGIKLTPSDFALEQDEAQELSDDELAAVAGGGAACACSGGGYGDAWGKTEGKCACVILGAGSFKDEKDYDYIHSPIKDGDGGCACTGAGAGASL